MDYAHQLVIPFQRSTTAKETYHGQGVILPEMLLDSISAWQAIKDDDIARNVGKNIQEQIDRMYGVEQIAPTSYQRN
jgi:hypothetical protein